jgi:transcriptional antiterminator RfaH
MFGNEPAHVPPQLIDALRTREEFVLREPVALHQPGEKLQISEIPLFGLEAISQMADAEARAIVPIEIFSRPTKLNVSIQTLRKSA